MTTYQCYAELEHSILHPGDEVWFTINPEYTLKYIVTYRYLELGSGQNNDKIFDILSLNKQQIKKEYGLKSGNWPESEDMGKHTKLVLELFRIIEGRCERAKVGNGLVFKGDYIILNTNYTGTRFTKGDITIVEDISFGRIVYGDGIIKKENAKYWHKTSKEEYEQALGKISKKESKPETSKIPVTYADIGAKVVRGKDWQWWDQDAGSEYGIITEYSDTKCYVVVEWYSKDGKIINSNSYRIGPEYYDLYYYEAPTAKSSGLIDSVKAKAQYYTGADPYESIISWESIFHKPKKADKKPIDLRLKQQLIKF